VKGVGLQRVQLPPGELVRSTEAIEAAAEATKLSELSTADGIGNVGETTTVREQGQRCREHWSCGHGAKIAKYLLA